ncbi:hypothetical protein JYU34_007799 [Plutella xylostella]|uniref:Uncharacterized protein n=1 Tax=Plutella xylostella TaxID=51655 RepID=A0ABQ7QRC3_PLUXY|nr:hypothetical protein JYU34_007799 [Plutella xylostella]
MKYSIVARQKTSSPTLFKAAINSITPSRSGANKEPTQKGSSNFIMNSPATSEFRGESCKNNAVPSVSESSSCSNYCRRTCEEYSLHTFPSEEVRSPLNCN